MKRIAVLFLILGSALLVIVAPSTAKSITLKVSSFHPPPETSLASQHLVAWEKMVTEKTNGVIKFKNFYSGVLASPPEQLSLVQKGVVDVVVSYGWFTPTKLPLQDFDYVFPFGPTDPNIITRACRELYEEIPQFRENLAKFNCTRVFQSPGTTFVFLSKKPITKLDDFNGLKCAVIGRYFGRWIGAIGAVPVTAPANERYTMLQTGVVNASFNPVDLAYAFKDYEQGSNCLDPNILITNFISCWVNLKSLHKLSPEYQKILIESGKELEIKAANEINPFWADKIFKDLAKQKGFKLTGLSEKDRLIWAERCEDIPAEWAAEVTSMGLPGWDIVKRYQEITAKLGHKWLRKWGIKK